MCVVEGVRPRALPYWLLYRISASPSGTDDAENNYPVMPSNDGRIELCRWRAPCDPLFTDERATIVKRGWCGWAVFLRSSNL